MDEASLWERCGDPDWFDRLADYLHGGGDVNITHPSSGWSLLHMAAEHNDVRAIEFLGASGADPNTAKHCGWTPLHQAVDYDIDGAIQSGEEPKMSGTRAMLSIGASVHVVDKQGQTPRDLAGHYGAKALGLFDAAVGSVGSRGACGD